jgi:peptide/nickel transport system permease protein
LLNAAEKRKQIEDSPLPQILLLAFESSEQRFPINFLTRGVPYRLFGILTTDLHLFGVQSPGHFFLMGTDQAGRDIFSRVLDGAQISLTIGLVGVLISTLVGWSVGAIAGYFGGKTDTLFMRSAEVLMSIPALYLVLSVRNVFPTDLSTTTTYLLMIVVLSLTGWATMARVIRGMVLSLREEEYVLSAKALGATSTRILMRHILPNTTGYVIVRATLLIPVYILAEVTLSYLGIGIQEPAASWGNMLSAAQELRVLEQFSWVLAPGFFLFLTVLGFNFLGDGLRQSLSVRQAIGKP